MREKESLPQGYKASSLGIIPQDWEIETLGRICNDIRSGNNKTKYTDGKYPVYGSTGIIGYTNQYVYDKPLLLIARVGANAGTVNKVYEKCDVSDNTIIIDVKSNVHFLFLYNLLQTSHLSKFIFGSGQPLITSGALKSMRILIPPVEEQKKIAEILSEWDKAIELQTKLIEKLEMRKRALMQRLLTGHVRLNGYSVEWENVRLEQIISLAKGEQYNKVLLQKDDKYPVINGGIIPSGYTDKYNSEANTITISEGGNSCGYVNLMTTRFWCGGHCYAVKEKDMVHKLFLYQLLKYHEPIIMRLRVGSGLPNIQMKTLQKYRLRIPPFPEQANIASILITTDREIDLEKQRLSSLRTQKQGLMQQLLTGKKRFI